MPQSRLKTVKVEKDIKPKLEPVKPSAKQEDKKPDMVKVKKTGGRRWWMIGLGAGMILLAFIAVFNLNLVQNQMLSIVVVGCLAAGGVIIYFGIKKQEEGLVYLNASGKPKRQIDKLHPPNSLNIYPNKIDFEYEENPLGAPWQSEDDNQFYFMHLKTDNNMAELRLPDDDDTQRIYDPIEYGNVVTMPLNKKYFSWTPSTAKLIAMGVMAVIIIAELIAVIAIGG